MTTYLRVAEGDLYSEGAGDCRGLNSVKLSRRPLVGSVHETSVLMDRSDSTLHSADSKLVFNYFFRV